MFPASFATAATFLSFVLLGNIPHASAAPKTTTINFPAQPPAEARSNVVYDNFLGISWELSSFDTLWGSNTSTIPSAMQNYLSNIRARMQNDLRIRVGGNGMDASTYDPSLKDIMLTIPDPEAYFNEIPVIFGPVFFDVMNEMQSRVGGMHFMLGVSTRHPEEFSMGIKLTQDAKDKFGKSLDAVLLGNEPDLYQGHKVRDSYDMQTYISELSQLVDKIDNEVGKDIPRGGPTACCVWTLQDVLKNGLEDFDYKYYTMQRYPTHACDGYNEKNTNLTYYTTHANVEDFVAWNLDGISRGKELGVPVIFTEYNTVSCGGSNISDTFGAAMWITDAALQFAATNVTAAYVHTRERGILYNLFDPPPPNVTAAADGSDWYTGSPYYPLLFTAEAISAKGSIVTDLKLELGGDDRIGGYAIWDGNDAHRGKLVLLNYADKEDVRVFHIPQNVSASTVGVRYFTADLLTARSNITWATQSIGANGQLSGARKTEYITCSNGCNVTVPSPGIALVFVDVDSEATDTPFDTDISYAAAQVSPPKKHKSAGERTIAALSGIVLSGVLVSFALIL